MVRIRLRRMGAKKKPFYRIVVANRQSPRDGRFIETIGSYNPLTNPETVTLQHDRAAYWLSVGAQPSDPVARLLKSAKLLDEAGKALPYAAEAAEPAAETVQEVVSDPAAAAVEEIAAEEPAAVEEEEDAAGDEGSADESEKE